MAAHWSATAGSERENAARAICEGVYISSASVRREARMEFRAVS